MAYITDHIMAYITAYITVYIRDLITIYIAAFTKAYTSTCITDPYMVCDILILGVVTVNVSKFQTHLL